MDLYQLFLAALVIFSSLRSFNIISFIAFIILSSIFYIILSQITGINKVGSLPQVSYPPPPHLGLDGISNENKYIN